MSTQNKPNVLPDKPLLRPEEVADYFRVHIRTVYRWCDDGRIETITLPSGCIRIPRDTIVQITFHSTNT